MLRAALDAGARAVVLGVGGSAGSDGGAGLLAALAPLRDRLVPSLANAGSGDPVAMVVGAAGVLLAVGALACWVPARRVSRIAPNAALRDGG